MPAYVRTVSQEHVRRERVEVRAGQGRRRKECFAEYFACRLSIPRTCWANLRAGSPCQSPCRCAVLFFGPIFGSDFPYRYSVPIFSTDFPGRFRAALQIYAGVDADHNGIVDRFEADIFLRMVSGMQDGANQKTSSGKIDPKLRKSAKHDAKHEL
eukprot:6185063-Pleurochrysis_carterae.AAC.2